MATLPSVQNSVEIENHLLESLRERAIAAGFEFLSTLIEDRLRETGPAWFRSAAVLERIDNYLRQRQSLRVPSGGAAARARSRFLRRRRLSNAPGDWSQRPIVVQTAESPCESAVTVL